MHVHQLDFYAPPYSDHLRQQLDPAIHITCGSPDPAEYEFLIAGRPTLEQLSAPHLRGLIIPFAGLPEKTRLLLADFPHIKVYNLHHNNATTAEMAIALLLAAARNLLPADRIFRQHDWTPRHAPMPAITLAGKNALILGYGNIGEKVGDICRALGMKVQGIERNPPYQPDIYPPDALHNLLPTTHALIICLPLTPETKHLINTAEIALLPTNAVIVNVGRAEVVAEQSLYEALRDQKIHAAGFDVWYNYPADEASRTHTPPANFPFHELDNMVMSPHRAGSVGLPDLELARMDALAEILNAAVRNEPIPNEVDLKRGY